MVSSRSWLFANGRQGANPRTLVVVRVLIARPRSGAGSRPLRIAPRGRADYLTSASTFSLGGEQKCIGARRLSRPARFLVAELA